MLMLVDRLDVLQISARRTSMLVELVNQFIVELSYFRAEQVAEELHD